MSNLTKCLDQFDASSLHALQLALQLESKRRVAAESLVAFTEFTFPRYQTAAIHEQIAEQLERVARDEIDRLMLLVPPRHGKSDWLRGDSQLGISVVIPTSNSFQRRQALPWRRILAVMSAT
jgi:hypothetical protein